MLTFTYLFVYIQSPPNVVSDERRKQAEGLFMELRNSKLPYNVCKFVLGQYTQYGGTGEQE